MQFAATIERAEKQIILAKHGRRLLNLLDDTPVVPGDVRQPFANAAEARSILNEAETELQTWRPNLEAIHTNAEGLGTNLMPGESTTGHTATSEVGSPDVAAAAAPVEHHHIGKDHENPEEGAGSHLKEAVAA